jgi:beta-glucosidase/6-phospho-beta-glucosidase/beta-galactosidase
MNDAMDNIFSGSPIDFCWGTGIEDTFVPQTRPGMRPLDEYELMGHYEHWRADLALAKACGAQTIRWGIPWYRVEPEQGRFDWSWTDQVIPYITDELGLQPILDLMHYGTPLWLTHSFIDPRYPAAVAAYARAVAERYGDRIRYYTPLNEPSVNALMCGKRGLWPPYRHGERGYLAVAMALAEGMLRTVRALREVNPHAIMVHVEATGIWRAAHAGLEPLAAEQRQRGYLFLDLLTGRVDEEHPRWSWLTSNGVPAETLHRLAAQLITLDIIGLNFYPQWSTRQIALDQRGRMRFRKVEQNGAGFGQMIADFYERYRAPIMITETSAMKGIAPKRRWLHDSVAAVRELRGRGVPVIGYTWFPLFTMVDWNYRTGQRPRNAYLIELGLYESQTEPDGTLRYVPTELVDAFRHYATMPVAESVGELITPHFEHRD